jgi:hypothetical protein
MTISAGDSREQREAEVWLINALAEKLCIPLTKRKWYLDDGGCVELDGFCETPPVLCEVWAHIGSPKSAQKHKVMTDALKLLFVKETLNKNESKCVLLFADYRAAEHFQGKSWMVQCLKTYDIAVEVIKLPLELELKVQMAQKRQFR